MRINRSKITELYIYIMLLIYPLFTGFSGYSYITEAKLYFFIALTSIWCIGLVIPSKNEKRASVLGLSAVGICILIYFLVCVLSAVFSPYEYSVMMGAGRFDGLLSVVLSVCIFLGVARYAKPKIGYVYALAISTTLCCVVALLQFAGLNPLWLFPDGYNYYDMGIKYSSEFLGTIGNANLFSAFLCLGLPLFLGVAIKVKATRKFLIPTLILGLFCLFQCTVSAGKFAFIACLLVGSPLLFAKNKKQRYLLFGTSGLIVVATLIFVYNTGAQSGTIYELSRILHGDIQSSFGSSRIMIWRECLDLFAERPLIGGGVGTTGLRLDISFSRLVEETGRTLTARVENAHNVYLEILINSGLLALVPYITAIVLTLIKSAKTALCQPLSYCIALALLCYWIQDFFGLGLFLVSPIMWILWGLLCNTATHLDTHNGCHHEASCPPAGITEAV